MEDLIETQTRYRGHGRKGKNLENNLQRKLGILNQNENIT